ncbi:hypothetical protein [Flavobacterium noncentrifugens]|uniref:hypothetical protein n=1 Tax=Flavobacterium noncentrifugens TaxID=1128970 RepID=UPI0014768FBC|nr:hypothetical protein [Flavobacterium noncentrifugens]
MPIKTLLSSNDVGSVFYFTEVSCPEIEMHKHYHYGKRFTVFRDGTGYGNFGLLCRGF